MLAFITVGSTKFDALVQAVLSQPVLPALRLRGYTSLIIQYGKSAVTLDSNTSTTGDSTIRRLQKDGVDIEMWTFKPSLDEEYDRADLVISHAGMLCVQDFPFLFLLLIILTGSGTIIDVLRKGKWLIVIPNPTLMDNHQEDLASALDKLGHLKASTIE